MYSPSTTGRIEEAGISTRWAMSGTLYAPSGYLDITSNAVFQVICGQGIFRLVNVQTGNHLNPSFYSGCTLPGYFSPGIVTRNCDTTHYWSFHSNGANWLLADGSVRFLQYEVGTTILPKMATRNGGETFDQTQY